MKRFLVCAICLVLMSGCFKGSIRPMTENFSTDFTASYQDVQLTGTLQRYAVGTLTMTLTSPASLAGLVCKLDNEEITLILGELEYKTAVIPAAAVPQVLRDVLDTLSRNQAPQNTDGTFSGMAGTYSFTASVASDSRFLASVSVPDVSLEIAFQNTVEQEV